MDRPLHTHLYAGLIVYRSQRQVEFLVVNDSFTNKKHWFCPKGLVLGQEDEVKCALRETFETTGLGPRLLRIEEGFKVELKYLSGTKPKKVVYYLAQLVDNHARLLPNAEGVHLQWCNQQVASEKVVFKSMQDVFSHAQHFVEIKRTNSRNQHQQSYGHHHGVANGGKRSHFGGQHNQSSKGTAATTPTTNTGNSTGTRGYMGGGNETTDSMNGNGNVSLRQHQQPRMMDRPSSAPVFRSSSSPSPPLNHLHSEGTAPPNNNSNPLFKTRLCERFETDGDCPYGPRCTFAHGAVELRGRLSNHENQGNGGGLDHTTATASTITPGSLVGSTGADDGGRRENGSHLSAKDPAENHLYKTKLCERYMKDQFCQYGPKCHFAHGRSELKERPNQQHHYHHYHHQPQEKYHSPDDNSAPHPAVCSDPALSKITASSSFVQQHTSKDQLQNASTAKDHRPSNLGNHNWRSSPTGPRHTPTETSPAHLALSNLTLNEKEKASPTRHVSQHQSQEQKASDHGYQQPDHQPQPKQLQHPFTQPRSHSQPKLSTPPTEPEAQLPVRPQPQHPTLMNGASTKKRATASDPDLVLNGDIMQTDKSWMKVVHLTKEEQAKLAIPSLTKTPSPTPLNKTKVAQEQAIIDELSFFFQSPESNITQERTQNIAKDVKQVTKVEMRHDLTKPQLFYILLVSLLQNSTECPVGAILRSRERLFKTFVKSTSDQRLLLKAWDQCVQRYPLVLPKTALVLSQWYEADLLDEEACYAWYEGLEPHRDLKKKTAKFIEWLKTADEEDDD